MLYIQENQVHDRENWLLVVLLTLTHRLCHVPLPNKINEVTILKSWNLGGLVLLFWNKTSLFSLGWSHCLNIPDLGMEACTPTDPHVEFRIYFYSFRQISMEYLSKVPYLFWPYHTLIYLSTYCEISLFIQNSTLIDRDTIRFKIKSLTLKFNFKDVKGKNPESVIQIQNTLPF